MPVYLDNSATTQICGPVIDAMNEHMRDCFGNPSSLHGIGLKAQIAFEQSCRTVLKALGAHDGAVYFTSGGTESNNLAIFGTCAAKKRAGRRIVATSVEHASVLRPLQKLKEDGWDVQLVSPKNGVIEPEDILERVNDDTVLLSMMKVNNETGAIFDVEKIARLAKAKNPWLTVHCDAVQAFMKANINIKDIDLLSASGHKLHAPKGIGILYVAKGVRILPILYGGGQQAGIRPGTESTLLAHAFAAAVTEAVREKSRSLQTVTELSEAVCQFASRTDGIVVNSPDDALPYIVNLSIPGIRSETMLHFLEQRDIYVSSGSACSKGEKSHVLTACGFPDDVIDSALRISFSRYNTLDDVHKLADGIAQGMSTLQKSRKH